MDNTVLEKFMERMGIKVKYSIERDFLTTSGQRYMCVEVDAKYRDEINYLQFHCYTFTNKGIPTYSDGNDIIGVQDSVFAYLGENFEVDLYFRKKSFEILQKKLL